MEKNDIIPGYKFNKYWTISKIEGNVINIKQNEDTYSTCPFSPKDIYNLTQLKKAYGKKTVFRFVSPVIFDIKKDTDFWDIVMLFSSHLDVGYRRHSESPRLKVMRGTFVSRPKEKEEADFMCHNIEFDKCVIKWGNEVNTERGIGLEEINKKDVYITNVKGYAARR